MPMVVWSGMAIRMPSHVIVDWYGSLGPDTLDLAIVPTTGMQEICRATIRPGPLGIRMGGLRDWHVRSQGRVPRPPHSDGAAIFFKEDATAGSARNALLHAWSALVECDRRIRDDGRRRVPPLRPDDLELLHD